MKNQNISTKLSVKTVMGEMKSIIEDQLKPAGKGMPVALYRIAGKASSIRTGTTQYGDWISFKGQFLAINLLTGEEHFGKEALFPGAIPDILFEAMKTADGVQPVEIALEITAKWAPTENEMGAQHQYGVRSLREIKPSDELQNILGTLPGFKDVPKLAAPQAVQAEPAATATTKVEEKKSEPAKKK